MMENSLDIDDDHLLEEPSAVVWFTIYTEVPVLANRDPVCSIVPLQNNGSNFFVYEDAPSSAVWPWMGCGTMTTLSRITFLTC